MEKFKKKGQAWLPLAAFVLIAVLVLHVTGMVDFEKWAGKEVVDDVPVAFCDPTAGITVKLDAKDPWGAVSISGSNYYKIKNGDEGALSSVSDAGTFSAPALKQLDLWIQLDGNDHYTVEMLNQDIECTSPKLFTVDVMPEGNFTTYVYDTDNENQLSNVSSALPDYNQSLSANKIRKLRFRVEQENERYTSASTVVCFGNNTNFDEIKILDSSGNALSTASLPESYSGTTGFNEWAYLFPALGSNAEWNGYLMLDTDDNNNPGDGDSLSDIDSLVQCRWYDTDCVEIDDAPYAVCGVTEDPDDGATDVGDTNLLMSIRYD